MLTKFLVAFSILALVAAVAGTVPAKVSTYNVTLSAPAVVKGAALKAGDYKVSVGADKVTFTMGKESREVPAKVETDATKHPENQIRFDQVGNQNTITEISFGGSKTRLVFN